MTPTLMQRLKAWCHRVCIIMTGEIKSAALSIKGYWWMYLFMTVAILSWVGWMHERTDKLSRLDALQGELHDYRERSTLVKERILDAVRDNSATLQTLIDAQKVGPRHTACDTKQILADLRAQGVRLPAYPVEARCK